MNSASEAIHYGVPVICIPIHADQPLVANRMARDLKLGIQFDPLNLDSNEISVAIREILSDKSYLDRVLEYSQKSRQYDGPKNATHEIVQYMKQFDKKTD